MFATKFNETDVRSGMNETNKFLPMSRMEACEDLFDTKQCKKIFKKGQCDSKKAEKNCKKTCGLCKDYCQDTLEKLHCLSKSYSKYLSITYLHKGEIVSNFCGLLNFSSFDSQVYDFKIKFLKL